VCIFLEATPTNNPSDLLQQSTIPLVPGCKEAHLFINHLKIKIMVTVTNALERVKKDGTTFAVLEISGGVELVLSQASQRYYATLRKCTIPFTGTLDVAKLMIGQKIEGEVVKVIVEPYDFVNPRTGEVMRLVHSYAYRPKDSEELVGHTRIQELAIA
jgi:hypothetical protein